MLKEFSKLNIPFELIVVDDGSKDHTFNEAKLVKDKRLRVLHYTKNGGKGNAIRYGLKHVKGDLVTFIDSDLDIHPSQIAVLLEQLKNTDADMVIASKRHKDSVLNYPLSRKIMSYVYYTMFVRMAFGLKLTDTQTGLKLFKTKAFKDIMPKILVKQYAFDLELCVVASRKGYVIAEAPVVIDYQFSGSGIKIKTIWKMILDTSAIWYRVHVLDWYETEGKYVQSQHFPYIKKTEQAS